MWIVGVLASSFASEPREITLEQGLELGMPRLHDALRDCDCVRLAWNVAGEDRVLDLFRGDIRELRQSVATDGQHELWLVHAAGPELLLERGPCVPVDDITRRYEATLGLVAARPGLDPPVCGDTVAELIADARAWEERMASRITQVQRLDPIAALTVTDRRGAATDVSRAIRRDWRSLRPRLSHCFTLGGGEVRDSARVKLVARSDGTVSGVRMLRGGTGVDRVDGCIVDLLVSARVTAPARPEKLWVELTPP